MKANISELAKQVMARCDELATCSEENSRITRRFLCNEMHAVHDRLAIWMDEAGLDARTDDAGNCIGRRRQPEQARVLLTGSHLDTVPGAGKYDGVLGVLVALAACQSLGNATLPYDLEVLGFSEEEGVRYRLPFLGSSAVAGCFREEWLSRRDDRGITMRDALEQFGCNPSALAESAYDANRVLGFIEPHLEQGTVLERANAPLGIVRGITGQSRLLLLFLGQAGHSGTTPMDQRCDALVPAAAFVGIVRQVAEQSPGLRATVGRMLVSPNVPNVIPDRVELSLDVRHFNNQVRNDTVTRLLMEAEHASQTAGCQFAVLEEMSQDSVRSNPRLLKALHETVSSRGYLEFELESGAGHDAAVMGQRFPMTMLFIRHPGGVSHHPDEKVDAADVAIAIEVLEQYFLRLADQLKSHGI